LIDRLLSAVLLVLIEAYRLLVSPMIGPCCRHVPSCSAYAMDAVRLHGALRGSWLAAKRVCRCHPFERGGYDPVPESEHRGP
jgi:putative membrane protein insertion efficiency factor